MRRTNLNRRQFLQLSATVTAGTLFAACAPPTGQPQATQEGIAGSSRELATVTFVEPWWAVPQYASTVDPIAQQITNRIQDAGIDAEFRSMLLDDHTQKYAVLYASGADFTCAFDAPWNKMTSLKDQGALLAIEELLEAHAPNIIRSAGPEIIEFNFETAPDGARHLFGIPARFYCGSTAGVTLRDDLREKHGAPAPRSEDGPPSLEPFLMAIRDHEPDMIPLVQRVSFPFMSSNLWPGARLGSIYAPGIRIPNAFEGTEIVDDESLEWWQTAAALTRDFYEKGYMPKEPPSVEQNVYNDYFAVERTACFQDNEPAYKSFEQSKALQERVPTGRAVGYDLDGQRAGIKGKGSLRQWNFVVFNANAPSEQHVAAAQIWNWFTSDQENADLWLMGIEGENFVAEPNLRFSNPAGIDLARNYRRQWFVSGITGEFQRQPVDLSEDAAAALQFFTTKENFAFSPLDSFSPSTKEIETDLAAINAAVSEAFFGVSMGTVPTEVGIAQYTQMMDAAGRQKVKEWYQENLNIWITENQAFIESFDTNY